MVFMLTFLYVKPFKLSRARKLSSVSNCNFRGPKVRLKKGGDRGFHALNAYLADSGFYWRRSIVLSEAIQKCQGLFILHYEIYKEIIKNWSKHFSIDFHDLGG